MFCIAVLLVSVASRAKICSLSKCLAPWSEAKQFVPKRKLRSQDCRLWACKDHFRNWSHDRVCGHSLVPSTRVAVELFTIYCCYWCLVSWVHTWWNYYSSTPVSWKRLHPTVKIDHWGRFVQLVACLFWYPHWQVMLLSIWKLSIN